MTLRKCHLIFFWNCECVLLMWLFCRNSVYPRISLTVLPSTEDANILRNLPKILILWSNYNINFKYNYNDPSFCGIQVWNYITIVRLIPKYKIVQIHSTIVQQIVQRYSNLKHHRLIIFYYCDGNNNCNDITRRETFSSSCVHCCNVT